MCFKLVLIAIVYERWSCNCLWNKKFAEKLKSILLWTSLGLSLNYEIVLHTGSTSVYKNILISVCKSNHNTEIDILSTREYVLCLFGYTLDYMNPVFVAQIVAR